MPDQPAGPAHSTAAAGVGQAIRHVVAAVMQALNEADLADRAEVYGCPGLTLTYRPNAKRVAAEAQAGFDHVRRSVSEDRHAP